MPAIICTSPYPQKPHSFSLIQRIDARQFDSRLNPQGLDEKRLETSHSIHLAFPGFRKHQLDPSHSKESRRFVYIGPSGRVAACVPFLLPTMIELICALFAHIERLVMPLTNAQLECSLHFALQATNRIEPAD